MNLKDMVFSGGSLKDIEIIDAHMHLNEPPFYVPDPSPGGVLKTMNRYSIDKGIVSTQLSLTSDMAAGNDEIIELSAANGRLLAYCTINPQFPAKVLPEIQKCFSKGAAAIKIHPSMHKTGVTNRNYYPLYEYACEHNVPVLSHTWEGEQGCSPREFLAVLKDFPALKVLMGHSGGTFNGLKETISAIKEKPDNLYADITGSFQYFRKIEILCEQVGADHVIFGSDSPWIDPGFTLGPILCAEISESDKKLILAGNIKKLLGME